ncbi:hypothetical protein C8R44DRAFT_877131 [Mycena epipterygia]|nr:hypothetical protein C8R44DRAFT_877131 [Mycena epipterygia]
MTALTPASKLPRFLQSPTQRDCPRSLSIDPRRPPHPPPRIHIYFVLERRRAPCSGAGKNTRERERQGICDAERTAPSAAELLTLHENGHNTDHFEYDDSGGGAAARPRTRSERRFSLSQWTPPPSSSGHSSDYGHGQTLQLTRSPSRLGGGDVAARLSGWFAHLSGRTSDLSLTATLSGALSHSTGTAAALASSTTSTSRKSEGGGGVGKGLLDKAVRYLLVRIAALAFVRRRECESPRPRPQPHGQREPAAVAEPERRVDVERVVFADGAMQRLKRWWLLLGAASQKGWKSDAGWGFPPGPNNPALPPARPTRPTRGCRSPLFSSYYFIGVQGDGLFYLDLHHARPAVPLKPFTGEVTRRRAFDARHGRALAWLSGLDPSIPIGFVLRDEAEWLPRTIFAIQDEPPMWHGAADDDESIFDPDQEAGLDSGDMLSVSHAPQSSVGCILYHHVLSSCSIAPFLSNI